MAYIRTGRPTARIRGTNFVPGGFHPDGARRFSLSARPLMLSPLDRLSAPHGVGERAKTASSAPETPASSEAVS